MKKLKVLHIQLLPLLSGVQNIMLYLLENLNREEYDLYVISAPGGPLIKELKKLKIKHFPVSGLIRKITPYDIIIFFKFYKLCRIFAFDIVHTHSSKTGFLGRIAAKMAGISVIIHTIHGFPFNPTQSGIVQIFYKILEKIAAFFCDKTISVNKSARMQALQEKIIPPNKIITIYNGIKSLEPKKIINREKLNCKKDDIIFGSVSRFSKQKNILDLIKVAIKTVKKQEHIKFVFLGDGEYMAEAKELIKNHNVKYKIIIPGWKSNIADWDNFFDVFILFSLWEGLSISIIEAMSLGKPIIASEIKGNDELVLNGKNGFLVKTKDKDAMVKKIKLLARDKELRVRMGEESYNLFQKKFTLPRFVNEYDSLYKKLYFSKVL